MLRKAFYVDDDGKHWATLIPETAPDSDASIGVPVGPSHKPLGLPDEIEVRLHNELFHRGILTESDARKNRKEVLAALQAALKIDVQKIVDSYEL